MLEVHLLTWGWHFPLFSPLGIFSLFVWTCLKGAASGLSQPDWEYHTTLSSLFLAFAPLAKDQSRILQESISMSDQLVVKGKG